MPWTHTLRLVSPWGCAGNSAYPMESKRLPYSQRSYPKCPIHLDDLDVFDTYKVFDKYLEVLDTYKKSNVNKIDKVNWIQWPIPYPETSLTLGMPRAYPNSPIHCPAHSIPFREAALQPWGFRRLPYGQETAPTVSPVYPDTLNFRNRAYPWYPAYTVFKKVPGATQTTRLQDCMASQQRA